MTGTTTELRLQPGAGLIDLKARLAAGYAVRNEPEQGLTRVFLDTFDWRVHQAGGVLENSTDGVRQDLVWTDRKGGKAPLRSPVQDVPRVAQDLPTGPLRDRLEATLSMRVLLPLVRVESRVRTLRVLGDEDKTVVRLELDQARYVSPDGDQSGDLGALVHLVPVKGYDRDLEAVEALLEGMLQPAESGLLETALQALGRCPGDYSSKLKYRLDSKQRADQATKEIQLGLLRTLEANIDGTRANIDSEFLHDLRVATRRARSALSQIRDVFPPEVVERFKNGFSWIGQITGPTRDMDVYLLALDGYRAELPESLREHLQPLRTFLEAHHASEQKILARQLGSAQTKKLLKDWRTYLEAPVPEHPAPVNAVRAVRELADERIWKMYRRVLKEGRAIDDGSPPEDLHELRKSCKKLRYLMEFFQSLYPAKRVRALVKIMKGLLDNLGTFQDLEVQVASLMRFAEQMAQEYQIETDTLLAMGCLIGGLHGRQQSARHQFGEIFRAFDTPAHEASFRALFKTRGPDS